MDHCWDRFLKVWGEWIGGWKTVEILELFWTWENRTYEHSKITFDRIAERRGVAEKRDADAVTICPDGPTVMGGTLELFDLHGHKLFSIPLSGTDTADQVRDKIRAAQRKASEEVTTC